MVRAASSSSGRRGFDRGTRWDGVLARSIRSSTGGTISDAMRLTAVPSAQDGQTLLPRLSRRATPVALPIGPRSNSHPSREPATVAANHSIRRPCDEHMVRVRCCDGWPY